MKYLIVFCLIIAAIQSRAQNKTAKILINKKVLFIEIADTELLRAKGLMNKKSLQPYDGMLFVFKQPQKLSFWMKNTYLPLSIGFFDQDKKLINVEKMKPITSIMQRSLPFYLSKGLAQYALEVPLGWFKKNKIHPGVRFKFVSEKPTQP